MISFFKKNKTIMFSVSLVLFLYSVPKLAQFGFIFSEYLVNQPKINYSLALTMSMVGFMRSYFQLVTDKKLNLNRAIEAYLAFGFGMSGIYYLVYVSHQGCFRLPLDIVESASIIDFVYFSFVTITTVGYGDIVPRHTFVRALVLFQVLFAVVLVLRVSKTQNTNTNSNRFP